MSAKRDGLDDAIDAVTARLTCVAADDGFASRIVNALPARSTWSIRWLMPRLAMTAAIGIAIALVVLRTFDEGSTDVLRTESARVPFVELRAVVERAPVEPSSDPRRTTVEQPANDRRTIVDHERSLAAIPAPAALSLEAVAPRELPSQGALMLEPLAIPSLPLTAENDFPR